MKSKRKWILLTIAVLMASVIGGVFLYVNSPGYKVRCLLSEYRIATSMKIPIGPIGLLGKAEQWLQSLIGPRESPSEEELIQELGRLGHEAVPALLDGLYENPVPAAYALGCIGDKRAIEPLAAILLREGDPLAGKDVSPASRESAVALCKLGDKRGCRGVLLCFCEDNEGLGPGLGLTGNLFESRCSQHLGAEETVKLIRSVENPPDKYLQSLRDKDEDRRVREGAYWVFKAMHPSADQ